METAEKENELMVGKLKRKCNLLIDIVSARDKEIEELRQENRQLKKEQKNHIEGQAEDLALFIEKLILIVAEAVRRDAVIPFAYKSKDAVEFVKVDCDEFDALIEEYAEMNLSKFLNYCTMLRLLCSKEGKKKFKIANIWVYKISKGLVEYVKAMDFEKEKTGENA